MLAWGVIAPVLDILIYSEAANKVFAQGLVAGIANSITVAIAGTLLWLFMQNLKRRQVVCLKIKFLFS